MKVNVPIVAAAALALLAAAAPLATADHWLPNCPHWGYHSHTYGDGGPWPNSKTATWASLSVAPYSGQATAWDSNIVDCNGDVLPVDYDGDYDTGIGGAFFGYGPWAHEPTCDNGLTSHGAVVTVNDLSYGNDIWFLIGADDTSGPAISVDPVSGATTCSTDGSITPGDPFTNPIADADDCLTPRQNAAVGIVLTTCGAGGDGGYWVFLLPFPNPPTAGTITA